MPFTETKWDHEVAAMKSLDKPRVMDDAISVQTRLLDNLEADCAKLLDRLAPALGPDMDGNVPTDSTPEPVPVSAITARIRANTDTIQAISRRVVAAMQRLEV